MGDLELQHVCCSNKLFTFISSIYQDSYLCWYLMTSLPNQLQMGVDDPELEDRVIQHLAATAAMRRNHLIARREGSRSRSSAHTHPQFVVLSSHPNASSTGQASASIASVGTETNSTAATETNSYVPPTSIRNEGPPHTSSLESDRALASPFGSPAIPSTYHGIPSDNRWCYFLAFYIMYLVN